MSRWKEPTVVSLTSNAHNAGPKAKDDIGQILEREFGFRQFKITTSSWKHPLTKMKYFLKKAFYVFVVRKISRLVVVQHPFSNKLSSVPRNKSIIIIHDIEGLRYNNEELFNREIDLIKKYRYVISHNENMKKMLVENGVEEKTIFNIELFDYLCDNDTSETPKDDRDFKDNEVSIVFSGNLDKSAFLKQIDNSYPFRVYAYGKGNISGCGSNIVYKGNYPPSEMPNVIKGDFGLAWDGLADESDEMTGFKNYTKFNNPHKVSCYIAAGIPVIVWRKSAIADFVKKNKIGFTISSLRDIEKIDDKSYNVYVRNVRALKEKVRCGFFTKSVFEKIFKEVNKQNNDPKKTK